MIQINLHPIISSYVKSVRKEIHMIDSGLIKEHAKVIGADGVPIGTVDRVENGRIKLPKADAGEGHHKGHHHFIPLDLVADIEGDNVRLSANGDVAVMHEEEESGKTVF